MDLPQLDYPQFLFPNANPPNIKSRTLRATRTQRCKRRRTTVDIFAKVAEPVG